MPSSAQQTVIRCAARVIASSWCRLGYSDELRAVLRVGGSVWGCSTCIENAVAIDLNGDESPGLLIFDERGALLSMNDAAQHWLDRVHGMSRVKGLDAVALPSPVVTALARARSIAAGHAGGPARSHLQSRTGRWLVVHASCLRSVGGTLGSTAVVVEPATSAEIAPIIVAAYGVTP